MLICSHVLCKVADIRLAVRDFEDLGFTVEWGSAPERAHNALIWFPEGPFIELFQLPPAFALLKWPLSAAHGVAAGERLARWARPGEGWRDVALETAETELAATRAGLRAAGVPVSRVMKGTRTRPDAQLVRYQFIAPRPTQLPFVVSSYDPPQRPAQITHRNGARGITTVRFGVSEADRRTFDALIGADAWLATEDALQTGVIAVEIAGLEGELDPARLHGAVLTAAARKE